MNHVKHVLDRAALPPGPAQPADDLDGLLRNFFRSEMPDPWPAPPSVTAAGRPAERGARPTVSRRWFRHGGRFALAAGVLFFLLGYLALTSAFPRHTPSRPTVPPVIGKGLEVIRDRVPLKGGGEAEIKGSLSRDPKTNQLQNIKMRLERVK
jgi:hypothetical protein